MLDAYGRIVVQLAEDVLPTVRARHDLDDNLGTDRRVLNLGGLGEVLFVLQYSIVLLWIGFFNAAHWAS